MVGRLPPSPLDSGNPNHSDDPLNTRSTVSVILPTHNRSELLKEAVASVHAQTFSDWEIVIVDDGSEPPVVLNPDETADHAILLLRNQRASGPCDARNTGIEAAHGEVLTFLDDDDLLAGNALETIARAFLTHPEIECLFVNIEPFGATGEVMLQTQASSLGAVLRKASIAAHSPEEELLLFNEGLFESLLDGLPLAFQRVALRRSVLQRTGLYQPGPFNDLEWPLRLALRCRCALLLTPLYRVRCDGQSYFTRGEAKEKLMDAIISIRCHLYDLPDVATQPRLARKVRKSLAQARFDKSFYAHATHQRFPWLVFFQSFYGGFSWRHVSLMLKAIIAKLMGSRISGGR